jgi:hypothetical protein
MIQDNYHVQSFQEKQYSKLAAEMSGYAHDIETWEKQGAQTAHLEEQTKLIAEKLQTGYIHHGLGWSRKVSVDPYAKRDLHIFGLNSKGVKKLDNYRNISILPIKARQQRNKVSKELQLFLHQNKYTRMWLFTDKRTTLPFLRKTFQKMHRKLSKLNDKKFMKNLGAKFVFRTSELGEMFPIGKDDISIHPHMHALLVLQRKLSTEDFEQLLKNIKSYWSAYCADSGIIRNARELTKYVVKPNDMAALNSEQTVKLYFAQERLHLVQPLAQFRKKRKQISDDNQKIIIRKGKPKAVPNWNRSTTKISEADPLTETFVRLEKRTIAEELFGCVPDAPKIVAWCTPSPMFSHVVEPLFMVHGLGNRDPLEMFEKDEVLAMQDSINVHTITLTVPNISKNNKQRNKNYESESKKPPKYPSTASIH